MQTDKDNELRQQSPECQEDSSEKHEDNEEQAGQDKTEQEAYDLDNDDEEPDLGLLHRMRIAVLSSLVIVVVVAICGIIFGLITVGHFTLNYAFTANFIVAAVMITAGLLLPLAPNRVVDKLRNRQLVEYYMHSDFMRTRASKQKQGYRIMWVGLSCAAITGVLEIVIWLIL